MHTLIYCVPVNKYLSNKQNFLKEIDFKSTGRIKGEKSSTGHRKNDFAKLESKRGKGRKANMN